MSINRHVAVSLSWIMMSSLLLGRVLSVFISWFHNMVTLLSWLVSTDSGTGLHQFPCLIWPVLPCICCSTGEDTLYHTTLYTVLLWILGMQIIMWSTLSYCWHGLHLLLLLLLLLLLKFIKNSLKFIRLIFNFCITAMFVNVGSAYNMSDIMCTMYNLAV